MAERRVFEGEVFHDWLGSNPEFNLRNLTEYPESERMMVEAYGRVVVPSILHDYLGERVRVTVEPADAPPSPARGDPKRCEIHGCWCEIRSVTDDEWDPDWFCPQCEVVPECYGAGIISDDCPQSCPLCEDCEAEARDDDDMIDDCLLEQDDDWPYDDGLGGERR